MDHTSNFLKEYLAESCKGGKIEDGSTDSGHLAFGLCDETQFQDVGKCEAKFPNRTD